MCSLSLFARAELAFWGAGVVALASLEVSGRHVLFLSVAVGVVAFALPPIDAPGLVARPLTGPVAEGSVVVPHDPGEPPCLARP